MKPDSSSDLIIKLCDWLATVPFEDWQSAVEEFPATEEEYNLLAKTMDSIGYALENAREINDVINYLFESMDKDQMYIGRTLESSIYKVNEKAREEKNKLNDS